MECVGVSESAYLSIQNMYIMYALSGYRPFYFVPEEVFFCIYFFTQIYLIQFSGSPSQSVLHRKRSHDNQPIGGVLAKPFSKQFTFSTIMKNHIWRNILLVIGYITVSEDVYGINENESRGRKYHRLSSPGDLTSYNLYFPNVEPRK